MNRSSFFLPPSSTSALLVRRRTLGAAVLSASAVALLGGRDALARVGGFDEDFVRAQDWELNHRLRLAGETVWFDPSLRVTYRPRGSLRA